MVKQAEEEEQAAEEKEDPVSSFSKKLLKFSLNFRKCGTIHLMVEALQHLEKASQPSSLKFMCLEIRVVERAYYSTQW